MNPTDEGADSDIRMSSWTGIITLCCEAAQEQRFIFKPASGLCPLTSLIKGTHANAGLSAIPSHPPLPPSWLSPGLSHRPVS